MMCMLFGVVYINATLCFRDKKRKEYCLTRMAPPGALQYAFVCEYEVENMADGEDVDGENKSLATHLVQQQAIASDQPRALLQTTHHQQPWSSKQIGDSYQHNRKKDEEQLKNEQQTGAMANGCSKPPTNSKGTTSSETSCSTNPESILNTGNDQLNGHNALRPLAKTNSMASQRVLSRIPLEGGVCARADQYVIF